MARRPTSGLTDGEARIMAILWDRKRATVAEVQAALKGRHKVTYSTVQTILRILEAKGYVGHDKEGRAFVFRPIVDERQARRRALRHILARLFDNSPSLLVLNVLEDERIEAEEMNRLRRLIQDI